MNTLDLDANNYYSPKKNQTIEKVSTPLLTRANFVFDFFCIYSYIRMII